MRQQGGKGLSIEWFNVTYRSVLLTVLAVLLAGAAGFAYWYYSYVFSPRATADEAITRAGRRLVEASGLRGDERLGELVESAEVALREAREARSTLQFDDARVAAIRSENLSARALGMSRGRAAEDRKVRFYRIEGDVRVKQVGEFSWESADPNMALKIGDQVKTSSSSSAQLIYFDGTITTIQPGSLLEIRDLYENPVTKVRRIREKLNRGELRASTQERNVDGSFHEVATETEKVSARTDEEGEFRVAYDPERKTSEFDVFEGRIEVSTPSRRESLVAGERVRSQADGKLGAKELLPGVPRLIAPRDQKVFIAENPDELEITLSWDQVPGAKSYRLVISDKPLFTTPLYDAERRGGSAQIRGVAAGAYFWKVSSTNAQGIQGPFSEARRFRVSTERIRDRDDTEPPSLEITEFVAVGSMVIVNGKTEPGATLWIDNEKIEVSDDGTFYAVVRMKKEGVNEIRFVVQDNAGNETEIKRQAYIETF